MAAVYEATTHYPSSPYLQGNSKSARPKRLRLTTVVYGGGLPQFTELPRRVVGQLRGQRERAGVVSNPGPSALRDCIKWASHCGGRLYVLIYAEEVGRVVLVLYGD